MIGSQSAPARRVTVTKSFTPNTCTTPSMVNTASAKALPAAASALPKFMVAGSLVSRVNFMALGLGVGEGEALAMRGDRISVEGVEPTARFAELVQRPEPDIPLDE